MSGLAALHWPALYALANLLRLAVLLSYLVAGIGILGVSAALNTERETRRQVSVMGAGAVASVLPFVMLVLLPGVLGYASILPAEQAILALGFLPLSFAYAILRHRMLNVRLLQRWLVYGLLWVTLLIVGVAAVSMLALIPGALQIGTDRRLADVTIVTLTFLAGVVVVWLHGHVQRALDQFIFKDAYDYRASLQHLSRNLSLTRDLDTLGASLPATLRRLMNLEFAVLLVQQADGEPYAYGVAGDYQSAILPALAAAAGTVPELPQAVSLAEQARPVLLIPLRTHETLAGHLCLGPKVNGEPFRALDRDLLATLSGHLAAIVRNVQLVDDLRTQVCLLDTLNERLQRSHEEERARLAADLHDEPLQTAYHLKSQLVADDRGQETSAHYMMLCQALITQLHAICTAVRPAALDELGLASAIEVLALDRAAHADVLIRLDMGADLSGADLPRGTDLVLYRAAQEALTNSLRHGQPRTIDISLHRQADQVQLRVADDGIGFVAPKHVDDLAAAGHLGLMGLHHRVQRASGQMAITAMPGVGTTVQVELPLVGLAP